MKHYTKRKRPDTITISIDAYVVDKLDRRATEESRTRSNLIQKIVREYLDAQNEG